VSALRIDIERMDLLTIPAGLIRRGDELTIPLF
jgi:hypothetical protein